jgi:hypothetical protein
VIKRGIFFALLFPVLLIVAVVVAGDYVTVHFTQSEIAKRIEKQVPGSHANVTISSSPFLYHLLSAGKVEKVTADVSDVTEGKYTFQSIDVVVDNLQINRNDLFKGKVELDGLTKATITATLTPEELVQAGVLTSLTQLGVLGAAPHASVEAGASDITVTVGSEHLTIPYNSLVPCAGSAAFSGADLVLTCTTNTLPPALAQAEATVG